MLFSFGRYHTSLILHRLASGLWLRLFHQAAGGRPWLWPVWHHKQGAGWPHWEGAFNTGQKFATHEPYDPSPWFSSSYPKLISQCQGPHAASCLLCTPTPKLWAGPTSLFPTSPTPPALPAPWLCLIHLAWTHTDAGISPQLADHGSTCQSATPEPHHTAQQQLLGLEFATSPAAAAQYRSRRNPH